jgi:hypothetical protein
MALAACGGDPGDDQELLCDDGKCDNSTILVEDVIDIHCSTGVVRGLSEQIAAEVACIDPDALVTIEPHPAIKLHDRAVLPYLHANAAASLEELADHLVERDKGEVLTINSAYRTVVQQYMLKTWEKKRCGIGIAATPGNSTHENGRSLDVRNLGLMEQFAEDFGWAQTVPGDDVHFEHLATPKVSHDVLAFQRLWNANNPDNPINEDNLYGDEVAAALNKSPVDGFEIGATCPQACEDEPDGCSSPSDRVTCHVTIGNGAIGECIDTETTECDGTLYSGFCAGTSSIKCCAP